ncbi:hypothetical protein [Spiroplasma endosymbiont of Ammophila pubescens]|uniref:hypothetical protein n=1 Tax=Spiroplasma endosymbiont of Ammophila pubescens TaxID=3066315 RepID=UPI0032B21FF1
MLGSKPDKSFQVLPLSLLNLKYKELGAIPNINSLNGCVLQDKYDIQNFEFFWNKPENLIQFNSFNTIT